MRQGCLLMFLVACGDGAKTTIDATPGEDATAIDASVDDAPVDAPANPFLAVLDGNEVVFFATSDSGNIAPHHVLAGPATTIDDPSALAIAGDELFVLNQRSITVYPTTASGNTAPLRTIAGPTTGLNNDPHELAVANDEVFVGWNVTGQGGVLVFSAQANGDVAPVRRIDTVLLASQEPAALAVTDSEIFVGSLAELSVYPISGNGNIQPTRSITSSGKFARATSIQFTGDEMFVAREQFIYALPRTASGSVTPLRTITGAATGLDSDDLELFVHDDTVFVSNLVSAKVLAFPATGSGAISPIRAIYGAATTLDFTKSIVVVP